ncbi:glycosyltransferase [bacterium]|nr:glycosyltransferase [bacterium]
MGPLISVVTPVYNPKQRDLEECIASVLAQTYSNWELLLVDDKSPDANARKVMERAAAIDDRIRVAYRAENGGIVAASNDGLAMATGEFVALLDNDDVLEPDALAEVVAKFESDPLIDYVYTDETLMTADGKIIERFFKPDWSPERFRSQMYVCHLSVIRRSLMEEVGGFRKGYDGSQDYDLILRVTEKARKVGHVRKLLYHWRMAKSSVANNADAKPYAYDAGQRAIQSHCERVGIRAEVQRLEIYHGNYHVMRELRGAPTVSVLMPHAGAVGNVYGLEREHFAESVESLRSASTYAHIEYVESLVDFRSRAVVLNELACKATGEYLFFASEALEVDTPEWCEELLRVAQEPGVGVVTAMAYSAVERLLHEGFILKPMYLEKSHINLPKYLRGQRALLETLHEVSAVDATCAVVRRELFNEVGGFDETLAAPWDMVDFSLRLREKGLRNVVNPRAAFYEYSETEDAVEEFRFRVPRAFRDKWAAVFNDDPYRAPAPRRWHPDTERPFWRAQRLRDYAK